MAYYDYSDMIALIIAALTCSDRLPNKYSKGVQAMLYACMSAACLPCVICSLARRLFAAPQSRLTVLTDRCVACRDAFVNQPLCLRPLHEVVYALTDRDHIAVLAVLSELEREFKLMHRGVANVVHYRLAEHVVGAMAGLPGVLPSDALDHITVLRKIVTTAANERDAQFSSSFVQAEF